MIDIGPDVPEVHASWQSIDDTKPEEEGGPTARSGFNYQDEIAVSFLIQMLEEQTIVKVHCETHDDIVLVHCGTEQSDREAEYIQVKSSEQEKLWSIADLCQRKSNRVGTSIVEISLGRDRHLEVSLFRLVTLRPINRALEPLSYRRTAPGRSDSDGMKAICSELEARFPGIISPKGNGISFWLERCFWDQRHSEEAVRKDNLIRLIRFSGRRGRPLLIEHAELLLDELRSRAKAAGDAKWEPDRERKIITRVSLCAWWDNRTQELTEGATTKSGGKLTKKMEDAGLSDDVIALAIALRRDYAAETRAPRYLEMDDAERLRRRVQSEISSLRARFVAGQIDADALSFHSLCLERMDTVNSERSVAFSDQSAFLKGCMYDIADRCLLRFTRRAS